jgi:(1->4)-alpha-D-glucan 1-alpha-D-glucosylmutase
VPDAVRGALYDLGVLSYRLFYFERNWGTENHGAFKTAARISGSSPGCRQHARSADAGGFWRGADIELRTALNLYPSDEQRLRQIQERAEDKGRLLSALSNQGLLPEGLSCNPEEITEMTPELLRAIQRYLARTPSKLAMLQAEDLLGQTEQANLPGTVEQHPNWQRKLKLDIENVECRAIRYATARNMINHESMIK